MVKCTPNTKGPAKTRRDGRTSMYMNLGLYGVPKAILEKKPYKTVTEVRGLEQFIRDVGGFQHTYCDSFQLREEFESMFDMRQHNLMREETGADKALVDVYTKTRPEVDVFAWLDAEGSM